MPPFRPEDDETDGDFEWTPYAELHLINSLAGLKAVGINYHWCLAVVYNKFTSAMGMEISLDELEKHLGTFYDFKAAARRPGNDVTTFPNSNFEFALPPDEYPGLEAKKKATSGAGGPGGKAVSRTSTPTPTTKVATSSEQTKTEEKSTKKKTTTPVSSSGDKHKQVAQSKKLRKKPPSSQPPAKRLRR